MWFPAEQSPAGSDTPQDLVRRSIRPRGTLFCRVSDPAEQGSAIKYTHLFHCSAGSYTPQDLVPWDLKPRRILFCGVWYLAGFCSAGVANPSGKLRPGRIRRKSSESLPFPRGTTFEFKYLGEFEMEIKNNLGHESGAHMGLIHENNQRPKILCNVGLQLHTSTGPYFYQL